MLRAKDILLVEDNPYDVELMATEFRKARLSNELIVARDGEEALDYLYRHGKFQRRMAGIPALILLDIRLPKVNGIEVLHQIRHDADLRQIPIAVITSYPEARSVIDTTDLEVSFFEKPLDSDKLQRILAMAGFTFSKRDRAPQKSDRSRAGISEAVSA
jgi:CheY-like chemotaxis protein